MEDIWQSLSFLRIGVTINVPQITHARLLVKIMAQRMFGQRDEIQPPSMTETT